MKRADRVAFPQFVQPVGRQPLFRLARGESFRSRPVVAGKSLWLDVRRGHVGPASGENQRPTRLAFDKRDLVGAKDRDGKGLSEERLHKPTGVQQNRTAAQVKSGRGFGDTAAAGVFIGLSMHASAWFYSLK